MVLSGFDAVIGTEDKDESEAGYKPKGQEY